MDLNVEAYDHVLKILLLGFFNLIFGAGEITCSNYYWVVA